MSKYIIDEAKRMRFAGIYVLEFMINKPCSFSLMLEGNNVDLEPILEWLLVKEFIKIKEKKKYIPTETGREQLKKFMLRYSEFLNIYDIYCAVDLELGEFAFERYFSFQSQTEWSNFLNQQRFDDLRIAVAQFKNIDPVEIVFMSFISEQRFGKNKDGWQFDLLLGSVWDEILDICNTALKLHELAYEDEQGKVSANAVMEDILIQGSQLMVELHKRQAGFANQEINHNDFEAGSASQEYEVKPVKLLKDVKYEDYQDPNYKSSIWQDDK